MESIRIQTHSSDAESEHSTLFDQADFAQMIDELPATVIRCIPENYWDLTYISRGCIALTGYHPEAFTGSAGVSFAGLVHEEDAGEVRNQVRLAIARREPWDVDYRIRHRSGDIHWLRDRGKAIYGGNGEAVRLESMLIEITARTGREARLVETSEKLRHEIAEHERDRRELEKREKSLAMLLDNLHGVAFRCANDKHWTMYYMSQGCKALTGYDRSEIIENRDLSYADIQHPDDRVRLDGVVQKAIDMNRSWDTTYRIRTKQGDDIWVWEQGCGVFSENGELEGLEGFIIDVTERRQLEAQLVQSSKMESIGQLAAGIAHEINTPIQFVGDNIRFLKDGFEDLARLTELYERLRLEVQQFPVNAKLLQQIRNTTEDADLEYLLEEVPAAIDQSTGGIDRISNIVSAMKQFSHPGSRECESIDLNQSIESTITVSTNEWKYQARIETEFDPELP